MTYDAEVLADTPIVYLKLDETSGTSAADSSGNGYTFTYQSGVTLGKPGVCYDGGKGFSASGSADGATRAVPSSLVSPASWSLECWVDLTSTAEQWLVLVGSGSNGYGLLIYGGTYCGIAGGLTLVDSGVAATTGVHHIVVTYVTLTSWKIYVDGALIYTHGIQPYNGASTGITIARSGTPSSTVVDNVAIYNLDLSAARVLAHYNAGAVPPPSPMSITATVDDVRGTVGLYVADGDPEYTVTAHPSGGRSYPVRSAFGSVAGEPDSRVAVDADIPLNTPTYYEATDSLGATAVSDTVILERDPATDVAVIGDALDPYTTLDVTIISQPPNRWEGRSVWWDVLGSPAPFPSVAPMRLRSGVLKLRTETRAERLSLLSILSTGRPLLLRSPYVDAVDPVVMLVESVDEELVLEELPSGPRVWSLTYQAVSRDPLGVYLYTPGRTYTDLNSDAATYGDLSALFGTYQLLRAGT